MIVEQAASERLEAARERQRYKLEDFLAKYAKLA